MDTPFSPISLWQLARIQSSFRVGRIGKGFPLWSMAILISLSIECTRLRHPSAYSIEFAPDLVCAIAVSILILRFFSTPSLGQVAGIPGVNSNPGEPGAVRRGAIARLIDVKFFVYRVQFHFSEFCANSLCSSITFGNAI